MERKFINDLKIENARIIKKNFSGEASKYNRKGDRNFLVVFDDADTALALAEDGWNIKQFAAREDDEDEPAHYLSVSVAFGKYPPEIYMITNKAKRLMTEETIANLDVADIANVDLIIRPYCWEVEDKDGIKTGVKAYAKAMYVVINEDDFAQKYERD